MFFSQNQLKDMIKNISKNTHANSTNANNTTNNQFNGCNHVQLGGMAHYDERRYFMFAPDYCVPNVVQRVRRMCGVAQQMTDGTFEFMSQPKLRAQSKLIKKLTHGRVSLTKDKAIQLTLKVMRNENINIAETIAAWHYARILWSLFIPFPGKRWDSG